MKQTIICLLTLLISGVCHAQNYDDMLIRISEIEVYPEYLSEYMTYALTVGETSVREEPGVIAIFPMVTKRDSTQIRIVEIYRDQEAYKAHIASKHFQTYKQGTLHMVKHLDLVDMDALNPAAMGVVFRKMRAPIVGKRISPRPDVSPTTLIVMYDSDKGKKHLLKAIKEMGAEVKYDYKTMSGLAIKKPANLSLEDTKKQLEQVNGVVSVSYDRVMQLH